MESTNETIIYWDEATTTTSFPDIISDIDPAFFDRGTPPPLELFDGYSAAILTFASISCIIFIIVGVPGNLITIAALAKCKKVRNATAVFIINLSLSDLLFCCFNLPLATSTFMNRAWTHGDLLCRLFPLLRYGLVAVSLFTILAITINRYVMIGHPRIYPKIYQRKFLIVMVVGCWIFAFLPLIFTWSGHWGVFGLDYNIGSCSILPVDGHSPKEFLFIIAFALPCLCIIICYARIFYIVRKTHESVIKSVGSIKIVHANSNMKISTSNAPLAEEEKLCYDEKKQQQQTVVENSAEKQLLPKYHLTDNGNNKRRRSTMTTTTTKKKNNNNNDHHEKNHKLHHRYSSNNASSSVLQEHPSNISSVGSSSCFNSSASNNENNIFPCKITTSDNNNGNESERTVATIKDGGAVVSRTSSLYNRQRKFLTKLDQDEELKFIDTSIESDLPPTLSNLRQKDARKLSAQLSVRINEMNNFVINGATADLHADDDDKIANEFDSAMEYSSTSTTNNSSSLATEQIYREIKDANKLSSSTQYLAVQIEPSSSSGIEIPYDQDTKICAVAGGNSTTTATTGGGGGSNCMKKRSFVQKLRKSTRLAHRKRSMGNTSGASMMYPGRMTAKDRRLLKMILVIFVSFVICYLPITINKTFESIGQNHFMNVTGYLLIYLTTCINPIIYVVMSSEYRQAYKNLLMCRNGNVRQGKMEIQRNASPRA